MMPVLVWILSSLLWLAFLAWFVLSVLVTYRDAPRGATVFELFVLFWNEQASSVRAVLHRGFGAHVE